MNLRFSYIKYLFQATNQHGVHSPFVYNLVTKGLYPKSVSETHPLLSKWVVQHGILNIRKQRIINRALCYLNNSTYADEHWNDYTTAKTTYFSLKNSDIKEIVHAIDNASFFILDDIHFHKSKEKWQQLKFKKAFTISVDFYNIGFLFIKKGQAKENFKIRI